MSNSKLDIYKHTKNILIIELIFYIVFPLAYYSSADKTSLLYFVPAIILSIGQFRPMTALFCVDLYVFLYLRFLVYFKPEGLSRVKENGSASA